MALPVPTPAFAALFDLELSDDHWSSLTDGAIDPLRIESRQYRTIPPRTPVDGLVAACLTEAGFAPGHVTHALRSGALVVPTFDRVGDVVGVQLRFDAPFPTKDGKGLRYTGAKGADSVRLDHGPDPVDTEAPLWITEGVKKADALAGLGLRAVALPGVWNWSGGKDTGMSLNTDIEDLPKGLDVRIVFDADTASKSGVAQAQEWLFNRLRTVKNASVKVSILPGEVDGTPCKGVDDHLALGFTLDDLEATLTDKCPRYVDVAAQERATAKITASADGTNPEDVVTDARMALMVAAELFPGRFRWAKGAGWMHWDGCRWAIDGDDNGAVHDAVRVHLDAWYKARVQASVDAGNARSRQGLDELRIYRSVLSRSKRDRIVEDAKNVDSVRCDIDDFDADAYVINTPSGLLDLRTGAVTPPDPSNLVTKTTGARYVPGARHADWDKALEAIPEDIRWWIQLRLGEALTGFKAGDAGVMFWFAGGDNGKSTVLDAVKWAMGRDYARDIPQQVILGDFSGHSTGWTTLRGLRLATVEELPGGRVLNMQAVKRLSGTENITARKMRQDDVTFEQTHSLIVTSNYPQIVTDTDRGAWKRLIRVPFPYEFASRVEHPGQRQGDDNLVERMAANPAATEAVFAWLVEGCMTFLNEYREPIDGSPARKLRSVMPDRVRKECEAWRRTSDPTYTFLTDELKWDANGIVTGADLLSAYNAFLATQGMSKVSARTLKDRLEAAAKSADIPVGSFSGPAPKGVCVTDVSRAPSHLVPEPSPIGLATPGNPFDKSAAPVRTVVRVYTGLRFRTAADDAADSAADAAAVAASESGDLVHAAELITATAAASGGTTVPTPRSDVDRDDDGWDHGCTDDGCDDDAYAPSVSPLCRTHLEERAEDAYGEDLDAYLMGSTTYRTAVSRAVESGGDVGAARVALARWLVGAALGTRAA